jgi:hypothetical protein
MDIQQTSREKNKIKANEQAKITKTMTSKGN